MAANNLKYMNTSNASQQAYADALGKINEAEAITGDMNAWVAIS